MGVVINRIISQKRGTAKIFVLDAILAKESKHLLKHPYQLIKDSGTSPASGVPDRQHHREDVNIETSLLANGPIVLSLDLGGEPPKGNAPHSARDGYA